MSYLIFQKSELIRSDVDKNTADRYKNIANTVVIQQPTNVNVSSIKGIDENKKSLILFTTQELLQQQQQKAIADINCIFGNCMKAQDNTCIRITRIAEKVIANDNNYKKYLKSLAAEQNITEKKLAENIIAAYEEETYLIAQIRILTSSYIKDINNAKTISAIEEILTAAKTFLQSDYIAELKTYYQANKSKTSLWSEDAKVKKLKKTHQDNRNKNNKNKNK